MNPKGEAWRSLRVAPATTGKGPQTAHHERQPRIPNPKPQNARNHREDATKHQGNFQNCTAPQAKTEFRRIRPETAVPTLLATKNTRQRKGRDGKGPQIWHRNENDSKRPEITPEIPKDTTPQEDAESHHGRFKRGTAPQAEANVLRRGHPNRSENA